MVRVLVAMVGLTLSVVLHELFHVLMHWGEVTHINFFPNLWTVVEIETAISPGYDLDGEEIVAYGITLFVLLMTTVIVFRIKDSEDKRSVGQILFPKDKEMQKMDPSEMLGLYEWDEMRPTAPSTSHGNRRR